MTNSPASDSEALAQLHPTVQRWVAQQGWPRLRDIQRRAILPILARQSDVLIMARTAGGKTEAAFLPIVSSLAAAGSGLRALCVSPLKALISDQAYRLTPLCEAAGLRLQPWHGDISVGKASFWRSPADILVTTPESLESMLMRRAPELFRICADLRYVVIDELHAYFGSTRGAQLISQLHRLEVALKRSIPRIALSATVGHLEAAHQVLRPGRTALPLTVIQDSVQVGELKVQVRAMRMGHRSAPPPPPEGFVPLPPESEEEAEAQVVEQQERNRDEWSDSLGQICDHLFTRLRGSSHLVFANSRANVEQVAERLSSRCEAEHLPQEFFAHHGTLSKELRVELEHRLRDGKLPTTAVCTSTLELGIDLGDVESVAQIGPPPSVSSLKQRLGRSGRRAGAAQILRQYVILPNPEKQRNAVDALHLPLVQAIATLEGLLAGEYESPWPGDLHLSTLVHQLLSRIVQGRRGEFAKSLYQELCGSDGPFGHVTPAIFADVLRSLGDKNVLEQLQDGTLLPGEVGEKLTASYQFYATFQTPEEFAVLSVAGQRLGTMPLTDPVMPGQLLIFAGRRWQVVELNAEQRFIVLAPGGRGRTPMFDGGPGSVSDIVQRRMRQVLADQAVPAYLDEVAVGALREARVRFTQLGLGDRDVVAYASGVLLGHWSGARVGNALAAACGRLELSFEQLGPVLQLRGVGEGELVPALEKLVDVLSSTPAALIAPPVTEDKFDPLLMPSLIRTNYAARHLDVERAVNLLKNWIEAGEPPPTAVAGMPMSVPPDDPDHRTSNRNPAV
jgi:ATP-dependent Lhr-like helicase